MIDNEILKERINKAENERLDAKKTMEKAQEKLERAEEAFTEDWREKNPNGPEAELLEYLDSKLANHSAAVESCRRTYDKLLETYDKLVEKMPIAHLATFENLRQYYQIYEKDFG